MNLIASVLEGDRLAISRLITAVENDTRAGREALDRLFKHTGHAHLIGVTGSPGTGKSSLVNKLALHFRLPGEGSMPRTVAIIAVDPTSPFSGGALLGDRVRMRELSGDPGVYIRSMAARGTLGGLAKNTSAAVQVLDAAGFDIILIETVGAGQSEVDIAGLAHTVLVIESPGMGDDIQAIKAGIMEIADILVVNKCDRPGAEATYKALRGMLEMSHDRPQDHNLHHFMQQVEQAQQPAKAADERLWEIPVMRTNAVAGEGLAELAQTIDRHALFLKETGQWQQREKDRLTRELSFLVENELKTRWLAHLDQGLYQRSIQALANRLESPHQVADRLFDQVNQSGGVTNKEQQK